MDLKDKATGIILGIALVASVTWIATIGPRKLPDTDRITALGAMEIDENAIILRGPVTNGLFPVSGSFIDLNDAFEKVREQVANGSKDVTIVIDSPGGVWDQGSKLFIDYLKYIKTEGVRTTCIVDGKAASMGLIIHSACSDRYATVKSKILWHSIAYSGNMRLQEDTAQDLLDHMKELNREIWGDVIPHFGRSFYKKHFDAQDYIPVLEVIMESKTYLRVINILVEPEIKKEEPKPSPRVIIRLPSSR